LNKNKLLIFFSIIFSLIIVEVITSLILPNKNDHNYKNRYMLFDEGKNFRNIKNFFTYHPNMSIASRNYYYEDGKFLKEYSYNIYTNNLGLVQKNDINKKEPSILFLGDSFTEGQGSKSWVDKFNGYYNKYQIINGGLLGTGFQQFELMNEYLIDHNIKKVFVLFLGDDLRRDIFQFNKSQIECLNNYLKCKGNEFFYGFPLLKKDPLNFLENLRSKQIAENKINKKTFKSIRRNIKSKIANLNIIKIPHDFFKFKFYNSKNEKILRNFGSIERLVSIYEQNIYFIHLKMKGEIINKNASYESLYVKKFIQGLTKNYFKCEFDDNLDFFYKYDHHPNKKGYNYLFDCVENILKENL
tara:strand:- start:391 stop:1458 length:1068 start_codon:yes stop_codon:yes gene_type:complete